MPDEPEEPERSRQTGSGLNRRSVLAGVGATGAIGSLPIASAHDNTNTNTDTMTEDTTPGLRTVPQVTLDLAKEILDAMEAQAEEMGLQMVMAVTDEAGNLIAQRRMDNAWLPSVNISRNKAYTAAGFEMPTSALEDVTTPGESLWGLQTTDESRIVVFGGGIPLTVDGTVVGAVGASGGQVSQDVEVAEAGVARFNELVQ